jgi:hypothetical protein
MMLILTICYYRHLNMNVNSTLLHRVLNYDKKAKNALIFGAIIDVDTDLIPQYSATL